MPQNGTITSATDLTTIGAKNMTTITVGDLIALANALAVIPTSGYTEATHLKLVLALGV